MTVYILRGLPGSGKSTVARDLVDAHAFRGLPGKVFSTDRYMYDEQEVYRFDPDMLGRYHALNFDAFSAGLGRYSILVVDNTNTRHWEYKKYMDAAKDAGYQIQVLTVGSPTDPEHVKVCADRNVHGVPLEAIQRMSARWEA